jgi:Na+-transporting NADH:ubiquinone oxidoreductase subunit A
VWSVSTAGVLAVDRALTLGKPSTVRIISLGGPSARRPRHLKAIPGYPLEAILGGEAGDDGEEVRVIEGGVLTGRQVPEGRRGLEAECEGLTLLSEHVGRQFLAFMRPGLDRPSYSHCFLSVLRRGLPERLSTAMAGEHRPCVSCIFCEEVCPVRIMPHLIHKFLYRDALEDAEAAAVERCMGCGLCSYVCPSKIELRAQMQEGQDRIELELRAEAEEVSA